MPPFSRFVNRFILVNRAIKKTIAREGDVVNAPPATLSAPKDTPDLNESLFPQELYERIIDHLHNNVLALLACSLVCKAWVPASRYHLFGHVVVRPLKLEWPRNIRVNCAASLVNAKHILYGTDDGIYASQTPEAPPMRIVHLPDPVTQLDVLEDFRLVVFLSARQLFAFQLDVLRASAPKDKSSCVRLSSHVSFFKRGVISGRHLICAVKSGGLTSTCKLLEPIRNSNTQTFDLRLYKDFYVNERVISLNFLKTKIVAGTSGHDFDLVDVESLATQPLLDPDSALPNRSAKCVAAIRTSQGVIVCYNSIAVLVDREGRPAGSLIQWRDNSIHDIAFHEPYLVAFGAKHFEIYNIEIGWRMQTVRTDYKLLSTTSGLFIIRTRDGHLFGLQFIQP